MRLPVFIILGSFLLMATFETADSQLTFGANGLKLPPINLLTVFRILRRTWNSFTKNMKPEAKEEKEVIKSNPRSGKVRGEMEMKESTNVRAENYLFKSETLLLDDLEQRINLWCDSNEKGCNETKLEEFLQETNTTLTQEEESVILKYNITESLDIPVQEFTGSISKKLEYAGGNSEQDNSETENDSLPQEKNSENTGDSSKLEMSHKTPSFLPFPFASGAWIGSYIALNSVLLGLYLFLAAPYFLTGRTVHILGYEEPKDSYTFYDMNATMMEYYNSTKDDNEEGDDNSKEDEDNTKDDKDNTKEDDDNTKEDDDNIKEDDDNTNEGDDNAKENDEDPEDGIGYNQEGGDIDNEEGDHNDNIMNDEAEDEEPYLGYTTYGDLDMMMTYMMNEEEDGIDNEDVNAYTDGESRDEETECMENIMCLRPVYGARALSATSLALKLLEWIPGVNNIGSRFKRNIHRLDTAVARGRFGDCRDYICPKIKKRK